MTLFAAAALVQAVATFNPPLDRPIAYTVSEVREGGAAAQRFSVDRRVTFRRREGGFRAEVETLRTHSTSNPRPATMLQAANAAMIDRRVVLLLDASGGLVDVEDLAAVWAAQVDGLVATIAGPQAGGRAATVTALLGPLRAMTVDQQRRRIGDMLASLIGSELVARGTRPPHPVSVPARRLDGARTILTGSEATTAAVDGMLLYERTVTDGGKRVRVSRRIDPASGLVRETVETTETGAGDTLMRVTRSIVISS